MPETFHGYGYGAWSNPGMWAGNSRSRVGVFHGGGSGAVGQFGAPMGRPGSVHGTPVQKAGNVGTVSAVDPLGGMEWGKGTAAMGKVLQAGTRRSQPRARQGGFQDSAGERYIGDATYQPPTAALAPGNQAALRRGYPGAIETTATMGALAPGARVMPSGPRPAGPAPTPFALPAQAGSAAPGPTRRRGRAQSFGQLQFGGT